MPSTKRTTTKTGGNSKRTTTLSSTRGKTESYSNKPTKSSPRRTVSFNHKTGKTRTTHSTKLGGGWTQVSSRTTGGSKPRRTNTNRSRSSGIDASALLTLPVILFVILFGGIMYLFPSTIPWIVSIVIVVAVVGMIINLVLFLLPFLFWGGLLLGLLYLIGSFV